MGSPSLDHEVSADRVFLTLTIWVDGWVIYCQQYRTKMVTQQLSLNQHVSLFQLPSRAHTSTQ